MGNQSENPERLRETGRGPYHSLALRHVEEGAAVVGASLGHDARVGVVLGSGLGSFVDDLGDAEGISYERVPGLPAPTVPGHAGAFVRGSVEGHGVLCAAGRVHRYEGHPIETVVLPVRILARLGCRVVVLTNAAGGIGPGMSRGSLMLLADHLNLTGDNPLAAWPEPFVDMTHAYDPELRALGHHAAADTGMSLVEGVYAGLSGPSYETPAEIRMLRMLGADAVGMSTVLETIALRREGVRVGALSCITNLAAGITGELLSHTDVQATAAEAAKSVNRFLSRWVALAAASVA